MWRWGSRERGSTAQAPEGQVPVSVGSDLTIGLSIYPSIPPPGLRMLLIPHFSLGWEFWGLLYSTYWQQPH